MNSKIPFFSFGKKSWLFLLLPLLVASCFKNEKILPRSENAKKIPERIVSLGPAITKEIFILGAEKRLMANTVYCNFPRDAKLKEKVGDLINFNLERIVQLKPDLVIFTPLANKKKIAEMKKMNFLFLEIPLARNFSEIADNFIMLAGALGEKKKALDMVEKSKAGLLKFANSVKGLTAPRVFFQIGSRPLAAVNNKIFLHDCILKSGGVNIAGEARTVLYSYEAVVAQNPDVIIISSMGYLGELEKKNWLKYTSLNAVKNNRIHIIDSEFFLLPLPDHFVKAVEKLRAFFHPEIGSTLKNGTGN